MTNEIKKITSQHHEKTRSYANWPKIALQNWGLPFQYILFLSAKYWKCFKKRCFAWSKTRQLTKTHFAKMYPNFQFAFIAHLYTCSFLTYCITVPRFQSTTKFEIENRVPLVEINSLKSKKILSLAGLPTSDVFWVSRRRWSLYGEVLFLGLFKKHLECGGAAWAESYLCCRKHKLNFDSFSFRILFSSQSTTAELLLCCRVRDESRCRLDQDVPVEKDVAEEVVRRRWRAQCNSGSVTKVQSRIFNKKYNVRYWTLNFSWLGQVGSAMCGATLHTSRHRGRQKQRSIFVALLFWPNRYLWHLLTEKLISNLKHFVAKWLKAEAVNLLSLACLNMHLYTLVWANFTEQIHRTENHCLTIVFKGIFT